MRRIISFILIFGAFLPLTAKEGKNLREALPVDFSLLNDPAPRKEKNIHYLPAPLKTKAPISRRADNSVSVQTKKDWEWIGRVRIQLNSSIRIPQESVIRVYTFDPLSQENILVAKKALPDSEIININFPAQRTSEIYIEIDGMPAKNPIVHVQGFAVQLSDKKRIMLMGDSVTDGKFADELHGYRHMLYDRLKAAGYNIDFVGDFGDPPYEAHYQGGKKIDDFYPTFLGGRGRTDCTQGMNNYQPNIVAIHLGTNDISSETGTPISPYGNGTNFADTQAGQMATLLNYLLRWNNGRYSTELEKIIVSMIIPIKYQDSTIIEYNTAVAELVRDFQKGIITGQPEPIYIADNFTRIREYPGLVAHHYSDLYEDNLHPNNTGHIKLADSYYSAFRRIVFDDWDWFAEMAFPAGVAGFDHHFENQGVAVADVNGDGRDDFYLTRTTWRNKNAHDDLFISDPDLYFERKTIEWDISDDGASRGSVFFDADNDGDLDLFNCNSEAQNRLYENRDGDSFVEMTQDANIADFARVTTAAIALDANNDGQMDVYAVNSREENEMYLKVGIDQFSLTDNGANDVDETNIPSLTGVAVDYDHDNDEDIYIVKRDAANVLFRNDGNGNFSKLTNSPILTTTRDNGAFWTDLDNDGLIDLIISNSDESSGRLQIFQNIGNGKFSIRNDVSIDMFGYSVLVGDFNNDGWQDIITTNEVDPGAVYLNYGDFNFQEYQNSGAEIVGGDVRGAATLDFDGDGDLDLFCARADMFNTFHINNIDNGNHYLQVNVKGSYAAVHYGAKIWLYESGYLGDLDHLISYRELLSANGHISQSSPTQHFGMGSYAKCDLLIRYTTGNWVAIHNQSTDQRITISPDGSGQSSAADQLVVIGGNGQEQMVGTTLQQSLQVQALDVNNSPVVGAAVSWTLNSGDAQILGNSSNSDAIMLEAELGNTVGTAIIVHDPSASSGSFLTTDFTNPDYAETQLSFSIQNEGAYYGWLRLENISDDLAFYYSVDNTDKAITFQHTAGWQWIRLDSTPFQFAEGNHQTVLQCTQASLRLDKVLFTQDQYYIPQRAEESTSSDFLTDAQGLSERNIQLGTGAGDIRITAVLNTNPAVNAEFNLTSTPGPAALLHKANGDEQTGLPNIPLGNSFEVQVTDIFNNPIEGQPITFSVESGGGALSVTNTATDMIGKAYSRLTPGKSSSLQIVKAESPGTQIQPVYFQVYVEGTADKIVYISGANQSGTVMQPLSNPIVIQVLDQDELPAADYQIRALTTVAGGRLSESGQFGSADSVLTIQTNSAGMASIFWQLGRISGTQQLVIDAGSLKNSPLFISANATADQPFMLLKRDGDQQTGIVGHILPHSLTARLLDAFGNAISNYPIHFTALNSAGNFSGVTEKNIQTNSSGDASVDFTLGGVTGYRQIVSAEASFNEAPVNGSPVTFSATTVADTAHHAAIISGNDQSAGVTETLPVNLSVIVWDQYNNLVSNHFVEFGIKSGHGNFNGSSQQNVTTNGNGQASISYQFGQVSGDEILYANTAATNQDTLFFTLHALPDTPIALNYISGDGQCGAMNKQLAEPLSVSVTDQYNNGIPEYPVTFACLVGDAFFHNQQSITVLTDENGMAADTLTLGSTIGDSVYYVEASSEHNGTALQNSPIPFYASVELGEPSKLFATSPQTDLIGTAGRPLLDPLIVKITDKDDQAIPGVDVRFKVSAGGGTIIESNKGEAWITTDDTGQGQIHWQLGFADLPQQLLVTAEYAGSALQGSPLLFQANAVITSGKKLVKISGDDQYAQPNSQIREPLVIQVRDEYNYPVSNHPVIFEMQSSDGFFSKNNENYLLEYSDDNGNCSVYLTLGSAIGSNAYIVNVKSFDSQGVDLQGSPLTFAIHGDSNIPDADSSIFTAASPAPTNAGAFSLITVLTVDSDGNPIEGREVAITSDNPTCIISPTLGYTDHNGLFNAQASLPFAGEVILRARDVRANMYIGKSLPVLFKDMQPKFALAMPGDYILHPFSALKEPLCVQVLDAGGQQLPNYPVEFSLQDTLVKIISSTITLTDSSGYAACALQAGTQIGQTTITASFPGAGISPITFPVNILNISQVMLSVAGGNGQQAKVTDRLPQSIKIRAHDPQDRPIGHLAVIFQPQNENHAQVDTTLTLTNADGSAQTNVILNTIAGPGIITCRNELYQVETSFLYQALPANAQQLTSQLETSVVQVATASTPLSIMAQDEYHNKVPDAQIIYSVIQGDGELSGEPLQTTDDEGLAGHELVYHAPEHIETAVIRANVKDTATYFDISLEIVPGPPYQLTIIQGNQQHGIADHVLNQPIQAIVTDSLENRLSAQLLNFQTDPNCGSFLPEQVITDSTGIAQTEWNLGSRLLLQTAKAFASDVLNSPVILTAIVTANNAPLFSGPTEFTVNEKDSLKFTVAAIDAEGDSVSIAATVLPQGAEFNSETREFIWQPTFEQAGTHFALFTAFDVAGQSNVSSVKIIVSNINRAPQINTQQCSPPPGQLSINAPGYVDFHISASDPDNDALQYMWMVDDTLCATGEDFKFQSQVFGGGDKQVKALVCDQVDTVSTNWQVRISSRVDLSYFGGEAEPYQGNILQWQTRSEFDNTGFYILRANASKAVYSEIGFVEANKKGEYTYTDIAVENDHVYFYKLADVQRDGRITEHETIMLAPLVPEEFALHPNFPNPFNPATTLHFDVPEKALVQIQIYNVLGQLTVTLLDEEMKPGFHKLEWDAQQFASGTYLIVMNSPDSRFIQKALLIK